MPKSLVPLTIAAPGFLGLNTQQGGAVLPPGWATVLENIVYDDVGRIASRKGSRALHSDVISSAPVIEAIHEYVDHLNNTVTIFAGGNRIFKEISGTVVDISGTITTPTGDNWKFVNFNDWCVGFQEGHDPIILTSTAGVFQDSGGTQYQGSTVLSAYGRLWTIFENVLYYSDLLINDFSGGSSGAFDLSKYWPKGMDEGTALADFNGFLIVFGRESTLVYENAEDVNYMNLIEGISGIGCIARDSVQEVGKELVFLSSTGLRGLSRTIKEESMPLSDISQHVRDALLNYASAEDLRKVRSIYNQKEGFYLLCFPATNISYMLDLKFPNPDGTWKAATWNQSATALEYTEKRALLMATVPGYLSEYRDYRDDNSPSGTGGSSYNIIFEGVWNDFGEEVANYLKMLKNISVLGSGTMGAPLTVRWAVDYEESFRERQLTFVGSAPSRYGIAQYGIDRYSVSDLFERVRTTASRTGQVVKLGVEAVIDGNKFAIQRMDVLAKVGKLGI